MLDYNLFIFILLYLILFYFINETSHKYRCYGARLFMLLYLFVGFKFWDGKQNLIPNVWQIVLAIISIQGRGVDSYIYGLFNSSSHFVPLPAY